MFDLPAQPVLDKHALVGGCVRLPLDIDAERLCAEVAALPRSLWGTTSGRGAANMAAEALFLRGYAPAAGEKPIEERPALRLVPYARQIIEELIAAPPLRCLLARLPAGASIAPHVDRAPYFAKTIRLHIPVETHDQAWMFCGGWTYQMRAGEVWGLNNLTVHAVWNAHPTLARTHLICDFLPAPALLDLLAHGERDLGRHVFEVERHLAGLVRSEARGHVAPMPGG